MIILSRYDDSELASDEVEEEEDDDDDDDGEGEGEDEEVAADEKGGREEDDQKPDGKKPAKLPISLSLSSLYLHCSHSISVVVVHVPLIAAKLTRDFVGPPKPKKRKTQPSAPEEVSDDDVEEPEGEEGVEEDADDGGGSLEDEDPNETAKTGGPAASAVKAKANETPRENDLKEVDEAEAE